MLQAQTGLAPWLPTHERMLSLKTLHWRGLAPQCLPCISFVTVTYEQTLQQGHHIWKFALSLVWICAFCRAGYPGCVTWNGIEVLGRECNWGPQVQSYAVILPNFQASLSTWLRLSERGTAYNSTSGLPHASDLKMWLCETNDTLGRKIKPRSRRR